MAFAPGPPRFRAVASFIKSLSEQGGALLIVHEGLKHPANHFDLCRRAGNQNHPVGLQVLSLARF